MDTRLATGASNLFQRGNGICNNRSPSHVAKLSVTKSRIALTSGGVYDRRSW